MKKFLIAVSLTLVLMFAFTACSSASEVEEETSVEESETVEETTESTTVTTTETTTESTTETTTTTTETTTKTTTTTTTTAPASKISSSEAVFALSYKDADVLPGEDMSEVLDSIGNPSSEPQKMPSCMDSGYDLLYSYTGFELESFKDEKGNETLVNINITSSSVKTSKGIAVGMKTSDAISKAGVSFTDDDGIYIYEKGDYRISLYDDEGKVDSIFIESTLFS